MNFDRIAPVMVTGATGLLGGHLVKQLNDAGIVPRVLVRRRVPEKAWGDLRVEAVPGNLTTDSGENLSRLTLGLHGVRTLFHLAAYVRVGEDDRDLHQETNLHGTVRLYDAASIAGVERFVHVSSIAAVGTSGNGEAIDEDADWNLASFRIPYFDTKRDAERFLLAPREELDRLGLPGRPEGPETVVVNPSIIIGERRAVRWRAKAIDEGCQPMKRAVKTIPRSAAFLRLFLFRLPLEINVVDADDVCRGLLAAATLGRPGERYLLTGHNLDWPALRRGLRPFLPIGPPLISVPRFALLWGAFVSEFLGRHGRRKTKWTVQRARLTTLRMCYNPAKAERELRWRRTPLNETFARVLGPARRRRRKER